ncbi:MAG: HIT domain-containing protein [Candidatus Pacearchaeota archaeon]|jgi:histidine triad (HIT) family protein
MEFSSEQLQQIKEQLISQINSSFPEDKKQEYLSQIENMNEEELIYFLEQNNLIKTDSEDLNDSNNSPQRNCVFCSIVFGDIPSTKINENESAIAILELNPISEGHALIVPKKHLNNENEIEDSTRDLAEIVSEQLKNIFNPKKIEIIPGEVMGHIILNILPIYEKETINSPRKKKNLEELKELQDKILKPHSEKKPIEIEKPKKIEISDKQFKLPRRIP